MVPELADRVRDATRDARFAGGSTPNYFRQAYGPGWALVGDAGYSKDPITAHGISDAFHDAEACSAALDDAWSGRREIDEALGEFQRQRDELAGPRYE